MTNARTAYREAASRGASGVRLVILLYEQAIQDLRLAVVAMTQGEIEVRTQAINHALTIIGHLQGTLDRERGGDVVGNLDRFYNCMRAQLMEAQVTVSQEILQQQIVFLLDLREAWVQVDGATALAAQPLPPAAADRAEAGPTPSQAVPGSWRG